MDYKIFSFEERYFAGIMMEYYPGSEKTPVDLWDEFHHQYLSLVKHPTNPIKYIGFEQYGPDFNETRQFDYHAMIQVDTKDVQEEPLVVKKLPAGEYICFPATLETLHEDIQASYDYVKEHNIDIHYSFDYEDYDHLGDTLVVRFCMRIKK
jgi:predicted transcriptional regulator YdeE